ncbi:hypothetical protein [Aquipseudomonas ullengensis]|uniref:Uncharacterized protein n=1 Tax=Aquipseudomonas ullengensis TaxID=2759166 RepID=A0A7W4LQL7_9GAMM|nr:hypothetical protein [Pseudomonas ullengensis]MBB2497502.1 hypothetical protein [Pseudomonas ullengensis]
MKAYSRALLIVLGIVLALLTLSGLVTIWNLSQELVEARQQSQAWKIYALGLPTHSLQAVQGMADACRYVPCCLAAGAAHGLPNTFAVLGAHFSATRLAVELHEHVPGSAVEQLPRLSF